MLWTMEIVVWEVLGRSKCWRNFSICLLCSPSYLLKATGGRKGNSITRPLHEGCSEKGVCSLLVLCGGFLHCFQIWPKICLLEEKDKQGLSESQHNLMPIPHTWVGTCEPSNIKEEVNPHCRSFGALGFIQNAIHYVKKYKIQKMNWNHRYLVVPVCFSIHTCGKFSV